jgi:hypothetical protein
LEVGSKAVDDTPVYIRLVLILGLVDLVEMAEGQPFDTTRWLVLDELGEQVVFSIGGGRPIHGCDVEIAFDVGAQHMNISRNKFGHLAYSLSLLIVLSHRMSIPPLSL